MPDFTGLGNHSPYFASNSHFVRLAGRVTPCAPVARRRSRTGRTSDAPGPTPWFPAHPLAAPALAAPCHPLHPLYSPSTPPLIPLYYNRGGLEGDYRGCRGGYAESLGLRAGGFGIWVVGRVTPCAPLDVRAAGLVAPGDRRVRSDAPYFLRQSQNENC